jgi:beta-glucosidase
VPLSERLVGWRSRRLTLAGFACALMMGLAGPAVTDASSQATAVKAQASPWTNTRLSPDRRAALLLQAMTLPEKAELMSNDPGTGWAYHNDAIPRLGIPPLNMLDAGSGLRLASITLPATGNRATAMPSTMLLAASFEPQLAARYGRTVADEARAVGGDVLLGPNGDIIRNPWWGRANETESEDPFLTGEIVAPYVHAVQDQHVIADLKHYNLYTQEINRCCGQNAVADERTIQEIYTPAWEAAVKRGGLGSTMCSFNKVNGAYVCQNAHLLTDVLKRQLGFRGFVLSDFGAVHDTLASLKAGLDMETGLRLWYTPTTIANAVTSGQVSQAAVDEHVLRILRTMFAIGLFDNSYTPTALPVDRHADVARDVADSGIVLLKNSNGALPLNARRLQSIAVIGGNAQRVISQGGASHVTPTREVSLVQGLRDRAPAGTDVEWAPGTDPVSATSMLPGPQAVPSSVLAPAAGSTESGLTADYFDNPNLAGDPIVTRTDPGVRFEQGFLGGAPAFASLYGSILTPTPGNAGSVRYTGTFTAPSAGPYSFSLSGFGDAQMFVDGNLAIDMTGQDGIRNVNSPTLDLAAGETREITIEYRATRPLVARLETGSLQLGWTHPPDALSPDIQEAVQLARDSDVAVVLASTFESEQRDRASLQLPNDQDLLIKAVSAANPNTVVVLAAGGPVTMPWLRQVPAVLDSFYAGQEQGHAIADVLFGDVNPSGKLPITFPRDESQPRELGVQNPWDTIGQLDVPLSDGVFVGYRGYDAKGLDPLFPFGYGLSYTRFNYKNLRVRRHTATGEVEVQLTVHNTGRRSGAETVQVYVGQLPTDVPTPPKQLAGFAKVELDPGEANDVTVTLGPRAFTYYSPSAHAWVTADGRVPIYVGSSSRDIRLTAIASIRTGRGGTGNGGGNGGGY